MIVIDASAIVEVLLQSDRGLRFEARLRDGPVHVPHLIDLEVTQTLRRMASGGFIDQDRAQSGLDFLVRFPLRRHAHTALLQRIWALRHNLTAYDAAYVALAEALDAPLLTADAKIANSSGHRAVIEPV